MATRKHRESNYSINNNNPLNPKKKEERKTIKFIEIEIIKFLMHTRIKRLRKKFYF